MKMKKIIIQLSDGAYSIHERPIDLSDHIVYIDRSMSAEAFFALHEFSRRGSNTH